MKYLLLLYILIATAHQLYYFQLKEYRFDRFWDFIRYDEGYKKILRLPTPIFYLAAILNLSIQNQTLLYWIVILSLLTSVAYTLKKGFYRFKPTKKALLIYVLNFLVLLPIANHNLAYVLAPVILTLIVIAFMPVTKYAKEKIISKAKSKRDGSNVRVIGITGSYGKSSTKELLYHLLKDHFNTLKTPKNINSDIGVAQHLIKNLSDEHQIYIVEMGAYRIGEIANICKFTMPEIGILTAIAPQHLSLFGSLENIKKAKSELLYAVPSRGLAIGNADFTEVNEIIEDLTVPTKTYTKHSDFNYNVTLVAPYLITNLKAAIIVAKHLGLSDAQIQASLNTLDPNLSPLKLKPGVNGSVVLDDSYNSNPTGFSQAIKLAEGTQANNKILLTKGMLELGKLSKSEHEKIAIQASNVFDEVILTKPQIAKYFKPYCKNLKVMPNPQKATDYLLTKLSKDDLILIENCQFNIILNNIIQK